MRTQAEPVASTSAAAATSTPSENPLKRKDRDEDEDEEEEEEEEQQDDDEKEDPSFGENEVAATATATPASKLAAPPAKKKVKKEKKPLVKKVAVWRDIQEWKAGDDPLGRFPVEVLDMIISVDSDLDLRDHLALAGTCRYFRSCYRDVVFQVLYHSKNPSSRLPAYRISIGEDGTCSTDDYYGSYPDREISFVGPVSRSWNVARRIFSAGFFSQDGWGVPNEEWESGGKLKQDQEREELSKLLEEEREGRRDAFRAEVEQHHANNLAGWTKRKEDYNATVASEAQTRIDQGLPPAHEFYIREPTIDVEARVRQRVTSMHYDQRFTYGSWLDADSLDPSDNSPRDPWESSWRVLVRDVVNKPKISRSDAKSLYKVSDRELLSLPLVKLYHWKAGEGKHFRRAAVEALALKSHGGVGGHDEYLEKLKIRKEKAHDTRVKNGTLQVAKPKPPKIPRVRGFW